MGRRALIIGVNEYDHGKNLKGCVHDAQEIKRVLNRHAHNEEEEKNFDTELITTDTHKISSNSLRDKIEDLFRDQRSISLLYFSGHGYVDNLGGYLMTPECTRGAEGISMNEVLTMANKSPANNRIIILDCCHSGALGENNLNKNLTSITEGVAILTASTGIQLATEKKGSGVFTNLLIHALEGGAANILGEVTAGNIYGYIDKAMGSEKQRPMFITNIRRYDILRKVFTQLKLNELRKITTLFDDGPNMSYQLDPTYEEESELAVLENVKKFKLLQKYNRVNLVIPIEAPHMFHAAMENKSCALTSLGKSYWIMVKNDII